MREVSRRFLDEAMIIISERSLNDATRFMYELPYQKSLRNRSKIKMATLICRTRRMNVILFSVESPVTCIGYIPVLSLSFPGDPFHISPNIKDITSCRFRGIP